MGWGGNNPIRETAPCHGCERDQKKPGCHDKCTYYASWKSALEAVNKKRKEYNSLPPLTTRERRYGK